MTADVPLSRIQFNFTHRNRPVATKPEVSNMDVVTTALNTLTMLWNTALVMIKAIIVYLQHLLSQA
jgi:hypothetical protein